MTTLIQMFEDSVRRQPQSPAIISATGKMTASYESLDERANSLARVILRHIDANSESPICVYVEGPGIVEAILAILKTGNTVLPLSEKLPAAELERILDDSETKLIIAGIAQEDGSPRSNQLLQSLAKRSIQRISISNKNSDELSVSSQEEVLDKLRYFVDIDAGVRDTLSVSSQEEVSDLRSIGGRISPEHVAWWLYTSGSTGEPKSVKLRHKNLVARIQWGIQAFPFFPEERTIVKASFQFVDFITELFQPLCAGAQCHITSNLIGSRHLHEVAGLIRNLKVGRLLFVPSLARALLELGHRPFPSLRYLTLSGEVLTVELLRSLRTFCPNATLVNLYGSTETTGDVLCATFPPGEKLPNTVPLGTPVGGNKVIISDKDSEIWVQGPFVVQGAVWEHDKDGGAVKNDGLGYFHTGDYGSVDKDGFFWYGGRIGDRVKVHGERVELRAIETQLQDVCGPMSHSYVVPFDDPMGETRLCAFVSVTDVQSVRSQLQKRLRPSQVPTLIVEWKQTFPTGATGKVDRRALQAEAECHYAKTYDGFSKDLQRVQCVGWDSLDLMRRVERTRAQQKVEAVAGNLYWLAMFTVIVDHLRFLLVSESPSLDNPLLRYTCEFGLVFAMDVFFAFAALQDSGLLYLHKFQTFFLRLCAFVFTAWLMESVLMSGWAGWFLFRRAGYMLLLAPTVLLQHVVSTYIVPRRYKSAAKTAIYTIWPPIIGLILRYGFDRTDFIVVIFQLLNISPPPCTSVITTPPSWGDFACMQYFVLPLFFGGAYSGFGGFPAFRVRMTLTYGALLQMASRGVCIIVVAALVFSRITFPEFFTTLLLKGQPEATDMVLDSKHMAIGMMPSPLKPLSPYQVGTDLCSLFVSFLLIASVAIILPSRTTFVSRLGNGTLPCYLLHYPLTRTIAALVGAPTPGFDVFYDLGKNLEIANMEWSSYIAFGCAILVQVVLSYPFFSSYAALTELAAKWKPGRVLADGFSGMLPFCVVAFAAYVLYSVGVLGIYMFLMIIMAAMAFHRLYLCFAAQKLETRKFSSTRYSSAMNSMERGEVNEFPFVLVQLPLYNEERVCRRVIEYVCRLDYPADRFKVQVLDDSTDKTQQYCKEAISRWDRCGVDIKYVRRPSREGFKAGALAYGLRQFLMEGGCQQALVAIFDADFLPQPGFLRTISPDFEDPKVGMVQARWGHLNRHFSWLTMSQGCLLDGHFLNEHCGRMHKGWYFNFNGTAGIWRAQAIISSGGWSGRTLTEDLDLSFRAQLRGWKLIFRPDVVVQSELPEDVDAFKIQQHRWAKGQLETSIYILGDVLRHPDLSRLAKLDAVIYLCANYNYPFVLLMALTSPFVGMYAKDRLFAQIFIMLIGGVSPLAFFYQYWRAVRKAGVNKDYLSHVLPGLITGSALAFNNTKALIEVLFGLHSEFRRTPKCGEKQGSRPTPAFHGNTTGGGAPEQGSGLLASSSTSLDPRNMSNRRFREMEPFSEVLQASLELVMGLYLSFFICRALRYPSTGLITMPLMCIMAVGFLYFGIASLYSRFQRLWTGIPSLKIYVKHGDLRPIREPLLAASHL